MSGEITIYRERTCLLEGYAHLFGGVISYNDPMHPEWPVLYIESPEGQMSWHIAPEDLAELGTMTVIPDYPWDQHTTAEKYLRLKRLVQRMPNLTSANPRYGEQ